LEKDESKGWKQKFKAIYRNHIENKKKYPKVKKHITIFVTNKISETDKIADQIQDFLRIEKESLPKKQRKRYYRLLQAKNTKKIENP
jgi:hypothetical protein